MRTCEGKLVLEAGAVIRKIVISRIKNLAFTKRVEIEVEEDRSLFSSNFRIVLRGAEEQVMAITRAIEDFVQDLQEEDRVS